MERIELPCCGSTDARRVRELPQSNCSRKIMKCGIAGWISSGLTLWWIRFVPTRVFKSCCGKWNSKT